MKIKIRYEYDKKYGENYYWAIAVDGLCKSSGTSFEEAKEKLIAAITPHEDIYIPPEEEVEI